MAKIGIMLARLSLAAWIGAASLFVVTGVREVTTENPILNNSPVKDALVGVRFPAYYAFGFTLVVISGIGLLLGHRQAGLSKRQFVVSFSLLVIGLLLMVVDYFWIYQPLLEMVTPAGGAKPAEFVKYHEASKHINVVDLAILLIVTVMICWPRAASSAD